MAAARADSVVMSRMPGKTWWPMGVPTMLTRIHGVAFSPDGTLWLGAREGVYYTRDMGKTWLWIHRLPFRDVDDLSYDAALETNPGQLAFQRPGLRHRPQDHDVGLVADRLPDRTDSRRRGPPGGGVAR